MNFGNFKSINKKYLKLISCILIVLGLIGIKLHLYFSNIKDHGEVARASQNIYQVTDTDKSKVTYEYENYSYNERNEGELFKEYHIFQAKNLEGQYYDTTYLVGKDDLTVYICDNHGIIIPYEEYINGHTLLGQYFNSLKQINYENIPIATRRYLEKEGGVEFYKRVKEIMDNADCDSINQSGGHIFYVDYIINGVNQAILN